MTYKATSGFYFGSANLNISMVGDKYPEFFNSCSTLITCLDSSEAPAKHPKWVDRLSSMGINYKLLGDFVWIPQNQISELFRDGRTFYHFDELYLFRDFPEKLEPLDVWQAVDDNFFKDNVPIEFMNQFLRVGAIRYLSDGCALNFVCESEELASRMLEVEPT